MKNLRILLIVNLIFFSAFTNGTQAQPYEFSLGLRIPVVFGISGKYFMNKVQNIEGIVASNLNDGISFTGLYEWNAPAFDVKGMYWFYGCGAHLNMWDEAAGLGVDGIIGLEYIIPKIPLNVSIDWKPALELIPDPDFAFENLGISVRYIFK